MIAPDVTHILTAKSSPLSTQGRELLEVESHGAPAAELGYWRVKKEYYWAEHKRLRQDFWLRWKSMYLPRNSPPPERSKASSTSAVHTAEGYDRPTTMPTPPSPSRRKRDQEPRSPLSVASSAVSKKPSLRRGSCRVQERDVSQSAEHVTTDSSALRCSTRIPALRGKKPHTTKGHDRSSTTPALQFSSSKPTKSLVHLSLRTGQQSPRSRP